MINSGDRGASGIYVTELDACLGARVDNCLVDMGDRVFQSYSQRVCSAAEPFAEYPVIRIGDHSMGLSSTSINAEVKLLSGSDVFTGG